jgi:radical SAM protein (TIGR01212 family)
VGINYFTKDKHYNTLDNYYKAIYNRKVGKVSLNAGFSCPNINSSGYGCLYCSKLGSGDFGGNVNIPLVDQFFEQIKIIENKWNDPLYNVYFQARTNTYASIDILKEKYESVINLSPKNIILTIATRPDSINLETIKYLSELNKKIHVVVELGLQTVNDVTASAFKRGYKTDVIIETVRLLKEYNLEIVVHVINGLVNETKEDMLNTIKFLNKLNIDGIKIHMLYIVSDSFYGKLYNISEFNNKLLSLEEYVDIVVCQLRLLRPNVIVHRITGDPDRKTVIAPLWTLKKFVVHNEIDKMMRRNNYFQGDLYEIEYY